MGTHQRRRSASPSDLRRARGRQGERKGVSRLFSRTAQVGSYHEGESVEMAGCPVTSDDVSTKPRLRLQLLRESHETNFRIEVMALDSVLAQKSSWLKIPRWERDGLVSWLSEVRSSPSHDPGGATEAR